MSNVIQFPRRDVRPMQREPGPSLETRYDTEPAGAVASAPMRGAADTGEQLPGGVSIVAAQAQPMAFVPVPVGALREVVEALSFYAGNGFDHGKHARAALAQLI